jgi:hypothetical protein
VRTFSIILATSFVAIWSYTAISLSAEKPTIYAIEVTMKEAVAAPVVCKGRIQAQQGWDSRTISLDGRVDVSVTVKDADGVPLNYAYEISAGRIVGQGPNIKWDLRNVDPGDYSITITVDDGVGGTGRLVKAVRVLESSGCQCICPSLEVVSHFSQIKPGGTLDFEAWVQGGDFESEIKYHWTVEKGEIVSGQGTAAIEVKAVGSIDEIVTARIEIGGIGRTCMCSHVASESVRIGSETKALTTPLFVKGVHVEGSTLYVECPRGSLTQKDSRNSYDLIANVKFFAISNSVRDKLTYKYTVTGGKVVGTGPDVNWDLTGFQAGVYTITVEVSDGKTNPPAEKKATVTLAERQCISLCPDVELSDIRKVDGSNDLILSANLVYAPETKLVWSTRGATIVAGQGSQLVRVRPTKGDAAVMLSLESLGESTCPRSYSRRLNAAQDAGH